MAESLSNPTSPVSFSTDEPSWFLGLARHRSYLRHLRKANYWAIRCKT